MGPGPYNYKDLTLDCKIWMWTKRPTSCVQKSRWWWWR